MRGTVTMRDVPIWTIGKPYRNYHKRLRGMK